MCAMCMALCLTGRTGAAHPEQEAVTTAGSPGRREKGSLVHNFHPDLGKEA